MAIITLIYQSTEEDKESEESVMYPDKIEYVIKESDGLRHSDLTFHWVHFLRSIGYEVKQDEDYSPY